MKHSYSNDDTCFSIDVIDKILEEDFDALLNEGSEILHSIKGTILEEKLFAEFDEFMAMTTDKNSESESDTEEPPFEKITFNTDYKIKTSLEEPPMDLELKPLLDNLEYVFLEEPSFLPVIISSQLFEENKNKLVFVLKRHKQAFAWKTTNIPGISTAKDYFPLPFMDQMIERLAGNKYFCFLDGFSGYFQIPIDPMDQEKRTLTCPFGTYTYRRIPFGLCNAPATFQRCMLTIFHDMIEESVPVFMDDFFVFGSSFDHSLNNLDKMLQCCKDAHIVLNWEKCHFMVKKGIVLGHKVSEADLEIDKAKIDKNSFLQQDNGKTRKRYGVNHRFSTSYHPQKSVQVENTNIALKRILKKTVKDNPAIWSRKLDDALWAFRTAYKTPTGTTPYKLIYGKNCHLPFEIEHRAYWALKNCNPDITAGEKRMFQLHELDELRHQAYENYRLYKPRTKVWHDRKLNIRKEFKHGNKVLLFHSKYKFKQPKLRSRWLGPYVVKHQYPSGYVELYGKDGNALLINGHRLKLYHEEEDYNDQREAVTPFFPKE
ncbi:reverse transcriptase domain-containing protein [Tanacetum coccineum]